MASLMGLILAILLFWAPPAMAAVLHVSGVKLEPCPQADVGAQPEFRRPLGASCYALSGEVLNSGTKPVVDTDMFAQILDASGEPVLQNRTRVGSIGDVPPGRSAFALRLSVPAGTPGPLQVSHAKAKGFSAPVRARAGVNDERLPLELELNLEE